MAGEIGLTAAFRIVLLNALLQVLKCCIRVVLAHVRVFDKHLDDLTAFFLLVVSAKQLRRDLHLRLWFRLLSSCHGLLLCDGTKQPSGTLLGKTTVSR